MQECDWELQLWAVGPGGRRELQLADLRPENLIQGPVLAPSHPQPQDSPLGVAFDPCRGGRSLRVLLRGHTDVGGGWGEWQ